MSISREAILCAGRDVGATYLRTDRFEPLRMHIPATIGEGPPEPSRRVRPCLSPVDWLLSWRVLAAATRRLGGYEQWVLEGRGVGYRLIGRLAR